MSYCAAAASAARPPMRMLRPEVRTSFTSAANWRTESASAARASDGSTQHSIATRDSRESAGRSSRVSVDAPYGTAGRPPPPDSAFSPTAPGGHDVGERRKGRVDVPRLFAQRRAAAGRRLQSCGQLARVGGRRCLGLLASQGRPCPLWRRLVPVWLPSERVLGTGQVDEMQPTDGHVAGGPAGGRHRHGEHRVRPRRPGVERGGVDGAEAVADGHHVDHVLHTTHRVGEAAGHVAGALGGGGRCAGGGRRPAAFVGGGARGLPRRRPVRVDQRVVVHLHQRHPHRVGVRHLALRRQAHQLRQQPAATPSSTAAAIGRTSSKTEACEALLLNTRSNSHTCGAAPVALPRSASTPSLSTLSATGVPAPAGGGRSRQMTLTIARRSAAATAARRRSRAASDQAEPAAASSAARAVSSTRNSHESTSTTAAASAWPARAAAAPAATACTPHACASATAASEATAR
eukprot:scaffold12647_cov101-Isochrysis_galbana.AAC.7